MGNKPSGATRCAVVLCGHGIHDPLVSTLMLDYILRLQEKGRPLDVLFVTEEPGRTVIDAALAQRLSAANIQWCPLHYKVSGAQFAQKIRNLFLLLYRAFRFSRAYKFRVVVGFLSMAGAYASVLRSLGFHRSIIVNFEPHSQYMKEMGIWRDGSFKYRVVRFFERRQVMSAASLIAPATAVKELVLRMGTKARVHLQGVTIDVESNLRQPEARERYRSAMGLTDKVVITYVGKFNGIYYSEAEYMGFMERTCTADPRIHHLVVTFPEHVAAFQHLPMYAQLKDRITFHGPVAPSDLPALLSAGDWGVIAVPPTPSQVYRSPVKTALYWAAGLPVIVPRGVSDDWQIAHERRVGVAVKDLTDKDLSELMAGMASIHQEAPELVQQRCIKAARELRDTSHMVALLQREIHA